MKPAGQALHHRAWLQWGSLTMLQGEVADSSSLGWYHLARCICAVIDAKQVVVQAPTMQSSGTSSQHHRCDTSAPAPFTLPLRYRASCAAA